MMCQEYRTLREEGRPKAKRSEHLCVREKLFSYCQKLSNIAF